MSNEFFTPSSVPTTGGPGSSATIRAEFDLIRAAFDKLPTLAGNAGEVVSINGTGTAIEASGVLLANLITLTSSGTLTNKTLNWANNTISTIPIEGGGTGATTLADAQVALGINLKANATNAVLSGIPVAETAPLGTSTTRLATTAFVADSMAALAFAAGGAIPGNATPLVDLSTGSAGTALTVSHEDHRHPVDTSRMAVAGGTFTGNVAGLTQVTADNSTMLATTAWVRNAFPTIAVPTSQVTGLDTALNLKAPLVSPAFTGNPTAPTQAQIDSTTKLATTEYVTTAVATATSGSVGVTTGVTPIMDSVGAIGVSGDAARADHVHPSDTTKQGAITGAATTITNSNLAVSMALTSDVNGKVAAHGTVSSVELGYLDGVTSPIQTQLAAKQAANAQLTTLAGITAQQATDLAAVSTFMGTVLNDADAAAAWATLTAESILTGTTRNFTKPQRGAVVALTPGATVAVDLAASNNFSLAMGAAGAYTLAAPSNIVAGQSGVITIAQNGTTAGTLAYNTFWRFPAGSIPALSTALSSVDSLAYYVESASYARCQLIKGTGA